MALFGDLAPDSYAAMAECDVCARRASWRMVSPERRRASRNNADGVTTSWYQNRYHFADVPSEPLEPALGPVVDDPPRQLLRDDLRASGLQVDSDRDAVVLGERSHRAVALDVGREPVRIELVRLLGRTAGAPQGASDVEQRHLHVGVHEIDRSARVVPMAAREHIVRGHVAVDDATWALRVSDPGEVIGESGQPVDGERTGPLTDGLDLRGGLVEEREERTESTEIGLG